MAALRLSSRPLLASFLFYSKAGVHFRCWEWPRLYVGYYLDF